MGKASPMRMCALSRTELPVDALLRFALGPMDEIMPDVDAKAPGRGVWITLSAKNVAEAVKKNAFAKSLQQSVNVPDDLANLVRERLEQRLLGALGLARKAGQLVTGAAKTEGALGSGKTIALLTASDAAEDGRRKMLRYSNAAFGVDGLPHFELLSSSQLGLALGQENVIHAALTTGAAAKSALARAERLRRYVQN